jgi:predicted RNA polymerase sigma factor
LRHTKASRSKLRVSDSGEPIPLLEQNRGRWDQLLILRGFAALMRAEKCGGALGPYPLTPTIPSSVLVATEW